MKFIGVRILKVYLQVMNIIYNHNFKFLFVTSEKLATIEIQIIFEMCIVRNIILAPKIINIRTTFLENIYLNNAYHSKCVQRNR